jgi:hypothetical protein
MITVSNKNLLPTKNRESKVLYFPNLLTEIITKRINPPEIINIISMSLFLTTGSMYKKKTVPLKYGSIACIITNPCTVQFKKSKIITKECDTGDVLILGANFRYNWKYNLPEKSIILYDNNYFSGIFLDKDLRLEYGEDVRETLQHLHKIKEWNQCLSKDLTLKNIGQGSYGNVFSSFYMFNEFAVKMSKIKESHVNHPYDISYSSWHEIYFLKKLMKPLIEKNICPNLPLIYDYFTCNNCELELLEGTIKSPCIISILEMASGTLKKYFEKKRSEAELNSALFQIMAALHSIQYYFQMMNYDVKKENILFYDVEPGGYWKYQIQGINYYVPNFGTMFILNDFGISRTMSPLFPVYKNEKEMNFRLGSRYAINKNGKFIPFNSWSNYKNETYLISWNDKQISFGSEFLMDRKGKIIPNKIDMSSEVEEFLQLHKIPLDPTDKNFYLNPEIIPPFEFYNDTQDVIRTFIGGKRTTQKGDHRRYKYIPIEFENKLKKFVGSGDSIKNLFFSVNPSQVLASSFIGDFFSDYVSVKSDIIDSYIIS